jgi:hypothetical protein
MSHADDRRLEELMREAAPGYRPPPEPRIDTMWRRIEVRAFTPAPASRWRTAWTGPLAMAAVLVLGLGVGFWAGRSRAPEPATQGAAADGTWQLASAGATPFVGVATNYLQQSTALMIAIAEDLPSGSVPGATTARARDLLSTTRLLLDSDMRDLRLRDLLEDLELVLAQVVRLSETGQSADATLITQALDQREVLPRLTSYLADASVAP